MELCRVNLLLGWVGLNGCRDRWSQVVVGEDEVQWWWWGRMDTVVVGKVG